MTNGETSMRLMMWRTGLVAVGTAFLAAPSAQAADDFFTTVFAKAQGGTPCYGRTYDDAHLKSHSQQTIRRIEIDMDKADANDRLNTSENFELGIAVMTTKSSEWYGNAAYCKGGAQSAECLLDGDGGRFKLTAASDGAVRLETGDYGIGFEGEKDFIELKADSGDDRVFVLKPGRTECDAATKYFDEASKADAE